MFDGAEDATAESEGSDMHVRQTLPEIGRQRARKAAYPFTELFSGAFARRSVTRLGVELDDSVLVVVESEHGGRGQAHMGATLLEPLSSLSLRGGVIHMPHQKHSNILRISRKMLTRMHA